MTEGGTAPTEPAAGQQDVLSGFFNNLLTRGEQGQTATEEAAPPEADNTELNAEAAEPAATTAEEPEPEQPAAE